MLANARIVHVVPVSDGDYTRDLVIVQGGGRQLVVASSLEIDADRSPGSRLSPAKNCDNGQKAGHLECFHRFAEFACKAAFRVGLLAGVSTARPQWVRGDMRLRNRFMA